LVRAWRGRGQLVPGMVAVAGGVDGPCKAHWDNGPHRCPASLGAGTRLVVETLRRLGQGWGWATVAFDVGLEFLSAKEDGRAGGRVSR